MHVFVYVRWLVLVSVLTACVNIEPPVAVTERTSTSSAGSTGIPATPSPGFPMDVQSLDGKIVYSTDGDIYVIHPDGSGRTRLTDHPAEDFDPVWSPDGTQIAFRSHRDGNEEVYVMKADGSHQQNISNAPGGDYSPAWSPDASWIAFMSDRNGGNPNVWVMQPDGSNPRQVTDIPGISEYPTWSPDSRRIAFHCTFGRRLPNGTGDFEICAVNFDGTDLVQLTDTEGENKLPAWSPDGSKIAFQSNRDGWPTLPDYEPPGYDPDEFGDDEIYLMNVDGSGQTNLTNNPREDEEFPAWSRDGHLVFSRYGCLMAIRADGSERIPIGSCEDGGQFPDWHQPIKTSSTNVESNHRCSITFVDERNHQTDIFTALADGSALSQLTNDAAQEMWPAWSPDGSQILYQRYEADRSTPETFRMSADGSGQANLTNNPGDDWTPTW